MVYIKCTRTCYVCQTFQFQYGQLIAVTYRHADASNSYIATPTDCQFCQMYASVNKNTIIDLPHSHTQTLALQFQQRQLYLDM